MPVKSAVTILAGAALAQSAYVVDRDQNVFKDSQGRQRWWHGVNFVTKAAPYYPTITEEDVKVLKKFGSIARVGVMMPGMFPKGPELNTTYLDQIENIVDFLYKNGIETIIDLHQDVLAPKICGEGTPDWMLNVTDLHAEALPRPMAFKKAEIDPKTGYPKSCGGVGALKFIGWSEWYMTDACGKAFQQVYDGESVMAKAFVSYWTEVAKRFKGKPGIMAYELLNEPWVGDHVGSPSLILEGGKAEKQVGKYMQKMHDVVKAIDPDTMVLYAPAEVNNRFMRSVGYQTDFLAGSGMAYHVYCVTGTDGGGATNPFTQKLCHFNDKNQMKTREKDLKRLRTAGFITEFGAVQPVKTGLAEVQFVLDHFDAMSPPSSWAFWDFGELTRWNKTQNEAYWKEVARPYPRALAGAIESMSFDSDANVYKLSYDATEGESEIFIPVEMRYSNGYNTKASPDGAVSIEHADFGVKLTTKTKGKVSIEISPKAASVIV